MCYKKGKDSIYYLTNKASVNQLEVVYEKEFKYSDHKHAYLAL